MRTKTVYVAFDGAEFDTAEACKAHEAAHVETRLVGLTIERVQAAINRDDVELADAIEEIDNRIARARREAGDFKRGRKAAAEPEAPKSPERTAEEMGREAFQRGEDRDPPDAVMGTLIDAWLLGYDYEHAAAKRAAA